MIPPILFCHHTSSLIFNTVDNLQPPTGPEDRSSFPSSTAELDSMFSCFSSGLLELVFSKGLAGPGLPLIGLFVARVSVLQMQLLDM